MQQYFVDDDDENNDNFSDFQSVQLINFEDNTSLDSQQFRKKYHTT